MIQAILARAFVLALLVGAGTAGAAEPGQTTYRDARHGFSLSYPDDWRPVAFKDGPHFHVLAAGGKGPEDCNVNVVAVSGPNYLERASRGQMLNNLRAAMRDAELVEWRRQTLDRRWGLYYIATGTTPRQNYKQTTLGFQVVAGAKLYTVSCSAPAAQFDQRRPLFEKIIASLAF
ncbi:MAG: hypothetical protein IT562_05860 [Alphaproteobacteria bacterium]|nr:hypothetical protein [Alphaproteobacteria bacterium]